MTYGAVLQCHLLLGNWVPSSGSCAFYTIRRYTLNQHTKATISFCLKSLFPEVLKALELHIPKMDSYLKYYLPIIKSIYETPRASIILQ